MLLNFSQFSVTDLEGRVISPTDMHKAIANAIFTHSKKMVLVDVARSLHESWSIEVSVEDIAEIKALMNTEIGLLPFAKREFISFIESCGSKVKEDKKLK